MRHGETRRSIMLSQETRLRLRLPAAEMNERLGYLTPVQVSRFPDTHRERRLTYPIPARGVT